MNEDKNIIESDFKQSITPHISNPANPVPNKMFRKSVIVVVVALLIVLLIVGFIVFQIMITKDLGEEKISQEIADSTQTANPYRTLEIIDTNFGDSTTYLYFSDANKIFRTDLNGSEIQEIASFPQNVASLNVLSDGTLIGSTGYSKYEMDPILQSKVKSSEYKYWIIKPNTISPEEIDNDKYSLLSITNDYNSKSIFSTNELPNGQAEILENKLDGTQPEKIGLLVQPNVSGGCEVDPCPDSKTHPSGFYPSHNGEYLLDYPANGAGLGGSAVVVSRDGSKVYDTGFYWYGSSAIWIGNNVLLTQESGPKQEIIYLNADGSFKKVVLESDLGGNFQQRELSPSGKHLLVTGRKDDIFLYAIDGILANIDKNFDITKYKKELRMLDINSPFVSLKFIGWNKNSDKILFAFTKYEPGDEDNSLDVEFREIRMYDLLSDKFYTVAKLKTIPSDYLNMSRPGDNFEHFAIE